MASAHGYHTLTHPTWLMSASELYTALLASTEPSSSSVKSSFGWRLAAYVSLWSLGVSAWWIILNDLDLRFLHEVEFFCHCWPLVFFVGLSDGDVGMLASVSLESFSMLSSFITCSFSLNFLLQHMTISSSDSTAVANIRPAIATDFGTWALLFLYCLEVSLVFEWWFQHCLILG